MYPCDTSLHVCHSTLLIIFCTFGETQTHILWSVATGSILFNYEGMLGVWWVSIPLPSVPQTDVLPIELHTPYSTDKGYRTQWHPGYEPGPETSPIGIFEESSGNDPQSVSHRSHCLANKSRRLQGLLSVVFTTGYDPITSDVSDRRSTNWATWTYCGQGRVRSYNLSVNSRLLYQLSYLSIMVGEEGLEPPRSYDDRFTVCWANQLLNSPLFFVHPTGIEPVTCCM